MRHAEPHEDSLLGLGFPLDLQSREWRPGPEEHQTLLGDTSVSLVPGTTGRHSVHPPNAGVF